MKWLGFPSGRIREHSLWGFSSRSTFFCISSNRERARVSLAQTDTTPLILTYPSQCLGLFKIFILNVIHFPSSIFPLQLIKWQKLESLWMMQEAGHGIKILP